MREPDARPNPGQHKIRGGLEQKIADEEHRRSEAIDGLAHAEGFRHLELGVGDVLTVDVGD